MLCVLALPLFLAVRASCSQPRFPRLLSPAEALSINGSDYPALEIELPVDHFNTCDPRTFSNRYWINDRYYQRGGPVFYFDAGEQDAQPLVPYFLYEVAGPSAIMTLARQHHGLALIFEHRFYGTDAEHGSFPFPMNSTTGRPLAGYNAYKYLNTEQALQDPVYFAHNFRPPGLEAHWKRLKPSNTPWIWLGGSYPGIRGAMMRVRNPETFFATWASSAPTQAAVDMYTYYAQAERSITRNCSADYTHVTNWVDATLANGTAHEKDALKVALYTAVQASNAHPSPAINRTEALALTNVDVANLLLLPLSYYQYYGFEASVQPFCDVMETLNQTDARTSDNGGTAPAIASESGIAIAHNISAAWDAFLLGIASINYDSLESPIGDNPIQDNSWGWQYCSEYGYYQRGNPENPHTIESSFISLGLFQAGCNESYEGVPPSPEVWKPNKYGGWHINPSNIMFTSGEYDPWRALSPASIEIGAPNRTTRQEIPNCNVAPPNDTIFGLIHRDMVHVSDMRALLNTSDYYHQNFSTIGFSSPISTEPFYAGLGLFSMALEQWLPCFGNASIGAISYVV